MLMGRVESVHFFKVDELLNKSWIGLCNFPFGLDKVDGLFVSDGVLLNQIGSDYAGTPTYSRHTMYEHIGELSLLVDEVYALLKVLF